MTFTIATPDQRSDAWRQARCGRFTASRAHHMMATIGKGEAAARRDLRLQLVVERLTGIPQDDSFVSKEMQRGTDLEPDAFAAYEAMTGEIARKTGFLASDDLLAGCSPDGIVGDFTGVVELKCPKSATHLGYLRSGKVPADYLWQITHTLWITGAQWADFVSFDDRFPAALQFFRVRVKRDGVDLAAYDEKARRFLVEVDRETDSVRSLIDQQAVA